MTLFIIIKFSELNEVKFSGCYFEALVSLIQIGCFTGDNKHRQPGI